MGHGDAGQFSWVHEILGMDTSGAKINAVNWIMFTLASVALGLRICSKLARTKRLWWDDHVLMASWGCLMASTILHSYNTTLGLGRHATEVSKDDASTIVFNVGLAETFSNLAAVWSQTSFSLTLVRLTRDLKRSVLWAVTIPLNLYMYFLAALFWTQCNPAAKVWRPELQGSCLPTASIELMYLVGTSYLVFGQFVLALMPWVIIMNLQGMGLKEKVTVSLCMSLSIFSGITAIIRIMAFRLVDRQDFFYSVADEVMWTQIEISATIVAASVPVLRALCVEITERIRVGRTRTFADDPEAGHSRAAGPPSDAAARADRPRRLPARPKHAYVASLEGMSGEGTGPHRRPLPTCMARSDLGRIKKILWPENEAEGEQVELCRTLSEPPRCW
ncbi:hypothetical protein RB600_000644 [Gaeumannomyces tritici]